MKRRYVAPARAETAATVFTHPLFAGFERWLDWCTGSSWPDAATLNAALAGVVHARTGRPLRFVAQTPTLLADGLHYEARIHERGEIATRNDNWHDLLNALVWCRYPRIKSALNATMRCCRPGTGMTGASCFARGIGATARSGSKSSAMPCSNTR